MGTFSLQPNRSGRFGSILVVLAALLFWGSWNGADNPLNPFYIDGWHLSSTSPTSTDKQFTVIDSLNGLAEQQAMAQKQQKPLLVMIHADWCVSCKRFEHAVLAQTDIKQKLTNWNTVAANITKYDEDDQLIMKKFDLVGPPVVLFFDQNGNELTKYRVVGEISHEDFAKRLEEMNKELHLS